LKNCSSQESAGKSAGSFRGNKDKEFNMKATAFIKLAAAGLMAICMPQGANGF
jgi:hypothetical protein